MKRERKLKQHDYIETQKPFGALGVEDRLTRGEVREASRGSDTEILYNMLIKIVANMYRSLALCSALRKVLHVHYLA